MKSLREATTKETSEVSDLEEIKQYLEEQTSKWLKILNSEYKTDGGNRLDLHSSGRLNAAIEMRSFISQLEKKNDKQI